MIKDDITKKLAQAYVSMYEKKVEVKDEVQMCESCGKVHEGACDSEDVKSKKETTVEALKGNQHKLDVDKDGDIEADDLAALRAKAKKKD